MKPAFALKVQEAKAVDCKQCCYGVDQKTGKRVRTLMCGYCYNRAERECIAEFGGG